jgi:hypothetical protein
MNNVATVFRVTNVDDNWRHMRALLDHYGTLEATKRATLVRQVFPSGGSSNISLGGKAGQAPNVVAR